MKQFDGYCIKTPHGDLWPAYFAYKKKQVIDDARHSISAAEGHNSWSRLQREGYSVVKVRIKEVREIA